MDGYTKLAVSVEGACRISGIGRTSLYQAISSGELPSLTFGKRRLVRVDALRAWLEKLEAASAKAA